MSKLRDTIFAKGRERGFSDEEFESVFKAVDAALQQFVGQPKTTELMLRVTVVGTAAIDQAFAEIERKRERDT